MKNIKKNSVIVLFITIVVLFFILKDDFTSIVNALLNIEIYWILIALLLLFIYLICKALGIYCLAKEYKADIKFKEILRQAILGQFFCAVTPFSTGGEPMQVYMLKKSGLKVANATSIIVQNFLMYQIALVIYGIIAVALNYRFNIFSNVSILRRLVIIGFTMNLLVCIGLILISISSKFNEFILNKIIFIGRKLKFVKDKNAVTQKYQKKLEEFHASTKMYKDKRMLVLKVFVFNLIGLGVFYLIPLFVLFSTRDYVSLNVMTTIVSSAYVYIIGSFVPIPGGSGGIEYGFMQFFGSFISGYVLSAILLLWRFITYYFIIIFGAIILNVKKGDIKDENRDIH